MFLYFPELDCSLRWMNSKMRYPSVECVLFFWSVIEILHHDIQLLNFLSRLNFWSQAQCHILCHLETEHLCIRNKKTVPKKGLIHIILFWPVPVIGDQNMDNLHARVHFGSHPTVKILLNRFNRQDHFAFLYVRWILNPEKIQCF